MVGKIGEAEEDISSTHLKGTTYRVYLYLVRQTRPAGISEIQRALGLSSPSVSQYHIKKLMVLGLVKEEQEGYTIDKMVLENIVRIRRISIPLQTMYAAFFFTTLVILLSILRPKEVDSLYLLAVAINTAALTITLYEGMKILRRL